MLLDMYKIVEKLLNTSPGTLLVHCSVGVGRTGAFIGLYKLIQDMKNKACTTFITCSNLNNQVLLDNVDQA